MSASAETVLKGKSFDSEARSYPIAAFDLRYAPAQNANGFAATAALEWIPISRYGKLGIGAEIGYLSIPSKDYEIPLNARLSYRFDYAPNQFVVPYVASTHHIFSPRTAATQSAPAGVRYPLRSTMAQTVGIQFRLNNIDGHGGRSLGRALGVQSVYLSSEFDVTDEIFLFGLKFEL
ncbi:MAG: hypothetical protein HYR96_03650 [Deltaproteobacteria bacterium]|nr:hypothetical protein [Deltaproteobacteria bacterium]